MDCMRRVLGSSAKMQWLRAAGGENGPAAFAEPDAREAGSLTEAAEDHLIAIVQKTTLFPRRKRDRLRPAPRELEQASARSFRGAGHRSARDQIARSEITSIARVMGRQLRHGPVHLRE